MKNDTSIVMPSFLLSLIGGVTVLFISLLGLFFSSRLMGTMASQVLVRSIIVVFFSLMVMHVVCGMCLIVGSFLIRSKKYSLAGSITVLVTGVVGIILGAGLFVGPIIALIGGIMGMRAHQRLITEGYIRE